MRRLLMTAAVAAVLELGTVVPAAADGWRVTLPPAVGDKIVSEIKDRFFIELEGGFKGQEMPEWDYGGILGTGEPVFSFDPISLGGNVSIVIGFSLGPGKALKLGDRASRKQGQLASSDRRMIAQAPPAPGGCNCAIVASFNAYDTSTTDNTPVDPNASGRAKFPIGGPQPGQPAFDTLLPNFQSRLKSEAQGFEGAVGYESNYPLGKRWVVSNGFRIFVGTQRYRNDLTITDPGPSGGTFESTVNERIRTYSVGISASYGAAYAVTPQFAVYGGVVVGVFYIRSKLDGTDCSDADALTPGCQVFVGSSVSRSTDRVGVRVGGKIGVGYDFGFATIGVEGSLGWSSAVPSIQNPTAVGEAASLGTTSRIAFGAVGRVTIPLN